MINYLRHGGFTCQQVAESGSAFVDNEMTAIEWVRYRLHLLGCPPCAEYVRQLGITVDALRTLPGDEGTELRAKVLGAFDVWMAESQEEPSED